MTMLRKKQLRHAGGPLTARDRCRLRIVPRGSTVLHLASALLAALLCSCKSEDISDLVSQVKEAGAQTVEAVKETAESASKKTADASAAAKEQLALSGSIELALPTPVTTQACYASLVVISADRPAVLKLQSYRGPDPDKYPSVYLQAVVEASTVEELVGRTVAAHCFVQSAADDTVWTSVGQQPLEVQISAVDSQAKLLTATVSAGSLRDVRTGGTANVTGKIEAVLP